MQRSSLVLVLVAASFAASSAMAQGDKPGADEARLSELLGELEWRHRLALQPEADAATAEQSVAMSVAQPGCAYLCNFEWKPVRLHRRVEAEFDEFNAAMSDSLLGRDFPGELRLDVEDRPALVMEFPLR